MGMPHALHAVTAWQALGIMAPLTFAGAALASHRVEYTVGHGLTAGHLAVTGQVIVVGVAFALTMAFNRAQVPTSTIQILVFTVAGVALAAGAGVAWHAIALLAVTWVAAPIVAAGLGYLLTRALDLVPAIRVQTAEVATQASVPAAADPRTAGPAGPAITVPQTPGSGPAGSAAAVFRAGAGLALALTAFGAAASFTMGANDVANATGSLVGTDTFAPLAAGLIGGAGLAAGVLTWGKPLLSKVAFDIVTSMNQALVGAMAGAGIARGRHAVHAASLRGIVRAWIIGPGTAITAGYLITLAAKTGDATLLANP